MPAEQSRAGKPALKANPLLEKLVSDPGDVPADATVIAGYLGKGRDTGQWRLYSTPLMNEFLEFAERDVVHTTTRDDEAGGKAFVWLKSSAPLRVTRIESHQMQADFLRGTFTRELMAYTPATVTAAVDVNPREASGTSAWWCTWKIFGCTREMMGCTQKRVDGKHRTEDYSCEHSLVGDVCYESGNPCTVQCPTAGLLCTVDCTDVC